MPVRIDHRLKTILFVALVAASSVFAAWMVLYCTPLGPGVTFDSAIYLDTARNLLSGNGFRSGGHVVTHYPPTYPLLLALPGLLGVDLLLGARWLQAIVLAGNVLLVGLCSYRCTKRSRMASLSVILLFLALSTTYYIHMRAWSEASFVLFVLASFLLLALYMEKLNRGLLIASALCVGLALTTRYAGISLFPSMLILLLFLNDKPIKGRIVDCLILLSVAILPLAVWFLRNLAVSDSATNRTMALHPMTVSHLQEYVRSILRFWLPDRRNAYIQLVQRIAITGLLLGGGTLGVSHALRQKKSPSAGAAMELLAVLYFITYTLFLFVSISFFDALTPANERIVYPIGVMSLVGIVTAFWNTPRLTRNPYTRWGLVALLCVLVIGNANRTITLALHYHRDGTGYTSRAWYNSETIAYVRSLPANNLIYASDPPSVLFHTGRQAVNIPSRTDPVTLAVNADFVQDIEAMRDDIAQKGALVIVFDSTDGQWFMPTQQELESTYGFQVLRQFQDGVVYGR